MSQRASGILLHISSLPSPDGIGNLGEGAYRFIDFLKQSGQRLWQVLPVNPTDGINGHSPYSGYSSFAGNPLFISSEALVADGLLTKKEARYTFQKFQGAVDYEKALGHKLAVLDIAFKRFNVEGKDFKDFIRTHQGWLIDFALFVVIKRRLNGQIWSSWPVGLKQRRFKDLRAFSLKNHRDIEKEYFIQYLFFRQFGALKAYAHNQGIALIGDIPIYVNYDSADVWCHPEFFKLDAKGQLKFVSGCPPDYFSKTGQRWGNPVYDWQELKKQKYAWWVKRIRHQLSFFDYLRIDHFRGFASFWQIPAHEKLAVFGKWVKGPGESFFKRLAVEFKQLPIIAEDLGEITPDVTRLMNHFKIPGMRVLLFAFGDDIRKNPYVPANYITNTIAYTGTHDNNTAVGWFKQDMGDYEKRNLIKVLGKKVSLKNIHWTMIGALMRSKAQWVIIPLQDVLGLDQSARMNTPATKVNNWVWRFNGKALNKKVIISLRRATLKGGRFYGQGKKSASKQA